MDLDFGPHRRCYTCGTLQPEPRCIEYNDHWFCGLQCKLKQEKKDDEALTRLDTAADVVPLRPRR